MNFIERLVQYGKAPGSLWLANTIELDGWVAPQEKPVTKNQMTAQPFPLKFGKEELN